MKVKTFGKVTFAVFNLFLFVTAASAGTDAPATSVGHVSDLAFLAGRWQGEVDRTRLLRSAIHPIPARWSASFTC